MPAMGRLREKILVGDRRKSRKLEMSNIDVDTNVVLKTHALPEADGKLDESPNRWPKLLSPDGKSLMVSGTTDNAESGQKLGH
jgi:hypothetical protein